MIVMILLVLKEFVELITWVLFSLVVYLTDLNKKTLTSPKAAKRLPVKGLVPLTNPKTNNFDRKAGKRLAAWSRKAVEYEEFERVWVNLVTEFRLHLEKKVW